jgi:hypothetical protein
MIFFGKDEIHENHVILLVMFEKSREGDTRMHQREIEACEDFSKRNIYHLRMLFHMNSTNNITLLLWR